MRLVPNFRYQALTQGGEVVSGTISAPTAAEVSRRIEYLGLVAIDTAVEAVPGAASRFALSFGRRPRGEDVTVFTRDLALLLRAGARLDHALELLADDSDLGRMRPMVSRIRARILAGDSFANAVTHEAPLFPPIYLALVRVGEASGTLDHILEVLANERVRTEAVRRRLGDAMRYPAFVFCAAGAVLVFFLLFVLPQFASVLKDFGARVDPIVLFFLDFSEFVRGNGELLAAGLIVLIVGLWLVFRRPGVRASLLRRVVRLPVLRTVATSARTALFCRNLGVLLGAGVTLPITLRILRDMMATDSDPAAWTAIAERVRHGGKLSEVLTESRALPAMAVRMLRLGEETGQLPLLAGRVAELFEAKLQRSLDRMVGIAGPLAIILISVVVGGLIVSVMTSLLSVSQLVG